MANNLRLSLVGGTGKLMKTFLEKMFRTPTNMGVCRWRVKAILLLSFPRDICIYMQLYM